MLLRTQLSERQWKIARRVARGEKNAEIGRRLGITRQAVKDRLRSIFDIAGVWNRTQLALAVVRDEHERNERKAVLYHSSHNSVDIASTVVRT